MLYTPKKTIELTGSSHSSLRNYTRDYARYFSTEATTTPRKYTEDDLRVIACIIDLTKGRGLKHSQVSEELPAALETFEWTPPESTETPPNDDYADNGDIVPLATLRAAQALLHDAQVRETAATEEAKAANERIAQLERELGEANGKLDGYRERQYRAPGWWRAIFGGEDATK